MDTPEQDPHTPTSVSEMAGATEWLRLDALLHRPDPPHILLAGGAGVGKSCALRLSLANQISCAIQCSHDSTLKDNRERIKTLARLRYEKGTIKWIVFEHADSLHADAQTFLRRIIETAHNGVRFLFEVRDSSAISEPLLSRTVMFNVQRLLNYEIRSEVLRRAPDLSVDTVTEFVNMANGNIRWAILQCISLHKCDIGEPGFIVVSVSKEPPESWSDVLRIMESIQSSGTNPRSYSFTNNTITWDRPGGICQWAVLAQSLSQSL